MRYRESEEMYLETILLLEERSQGVRRVDIAAELGYSKPSVSNAVKQLKQKGLVCENEFGHIRLTESGRNAAVSIYEKHHLITRLLVKIGADPAVAEENACRIEHVISADLLDTIKNYMNEAPACG